VKVFIKHMVCLRCQLIVRDELDRLGIAHGEVQLGEVTLEDPVAPALMELLHAALLRSGLQIIDDRKSLLIEKIKTAVIEQIHYAEEPLLENFSSFLEKKLQYDYTYLSNLFAATEGQTLEQYIIKSKIEKAKDLLIYEGLSVAKIASLMNYCSAAHLSKQFKKVTGFTASYIKKLNSIGLESPSQLG
jgi:AraC-like DNA-binding protein